MLTKMWKEFTVVCLICVTCAQCLETGSGLLLTNATHILFKAYNKLEPATVNDSPDLPNVIYSEPLGRIVGLAVDVENKYVFWSDISHHKRGIYKARWEAGANITDPVLLTDDVLEVNGIAVDWTTRLIFWTDARRRTIQVSDYDGNIRTLSIDGLLSPRGITVDPIEGWLYWNDQETRKIERSRLDGTGRETIIDSGLYWPNQMVVANRKLYWVDAWNKTIMISSLNGRNQDTLVNVGAIVGQNPIYGLAVPDPKVALVSTWNMGEVMQVNLSTTGVVGFITNLGRNSIFSVAYVEQNFQQKGDNPCGEADKQGCSHLCIPNGRLSGRCACPSKGGLALDADLKTCKEPSEVVLYTLADKGEVGYFLPDTTETSGDRYTVGRSLRPVAVAYDPVEKMVYWSDVHERTVHRATLDGKEHEVFLNYNHSLGIVDGLAVDYIRRRLYYSNMGQVVAGGVSYSWHKIEMINLDGTQRRTIYNLAERPRGLALDLEKGHVYYTDWGSESAVARTNLDGSNDTLIVNQLENPNGVSYRDGKLYFTDSHVKSQGTDAPIPPGLYTIGENNEAEVVRGVRVGVPFGVTGNAAMLFVSDWADGGVIFRVKDLDHHSPLVETIMSNVGTPMMLHYTLTSTTLGLPNDTCSEAGCDDICVAQPGEDEAVCACDSYESEVLAKDRISCQTPSSFILVADVTSIKLQSLVSDKGDHSTYTLVQGNTYFSNFAGLAYDKTRKLVYFSDVNRRMIYYVSLDGDEGGILYSPRHIIDNLLYVTESSALWWSDYLTGSICSLDVSNLNVKANSHKTWISGRSKPRGLAVDSDYNLMYWTEWGRNPLVARMSIQGDPVDDPDVTTVLTSGDDIILEEPNGLYLDTEAEQLYIGDGAKLKIIRCKVQDLNPGSGEGDIECTTLSYFTGIPSHIYSLSKVKDTLLYSDWKTGVIGAVSMTTGNSLDDVMTGLMRPAQFYVKFDETPECPVDNGCSDLCVPVLMSYECACNESRELTKDMETCRPATKLWQERPDACDKCAEHSTCARRVGTLEFSCQCKAGYEDSGAGCVACELNTFKPEAGPSKCQPCPTSSVAVNIGSTECSCSQESLSWDWKEHRCKGKKPGTCPRRLQEENLHGCNHTCTTDGDCGLGRGAQKCCGVQQCPGSMQCVDPVDLEECVYRGVPHYLSEEFKPNDCTTCKCQHDKYYGWDKFGGAKCTVFVCPPLPCDEEYHIKKPGACCPSCPEYQFTKELEFTYCPTETVLMELGPNRPYVVYDPPLTWIDHSRLNRDVERIMTPNVTWFWWIGNDVVQHMSVVISSRSPEGHVDRDVCKIDIIVNDNTDPVLDCQDDMMVYTTGGSTAVWWLPPVVSDNTGVPLPLNCSMTPGESLQPGSYNVRYTALDAAGNLEGCGFGITVKKQDIPCGNPVTPFHSTLDCKRSLAWRCRVQCQQGYSLNPALDSPGMAVCENGQWSPGYGQNYHSQACVQMKEQVWRIKAQTKLHFFSETTTAEILVISFKDTVTNRYLNNSRADLRWTTDSVELTGLDDKRVDLVKRDASSVRAKRDITHPRMKRDTEISENITLTFELSGTSMDPGVSVADELTSAMTQMINDLDSGNLTLPAVRERISMVDGSIVILKNPWKGCGFGQQKNNMSCIVCSIGTFLSSESGQCSLCVEGTYQDKEGQEKCKPCEEGKTSESGAYSVDMCYPGGGREAASSDSSEKTMIAGIAIGGAILVVIIILVVAVVLFLRGKNGVVVGKRVKGPNAANELQMNYSNAAFDMHMDDPAVGNAADWENGMGGLGGVGGKNTGVFGSDLPGKDPKVCLGDEY